MKKDIKNQVVKKPNISMYLAKYKFWIAMYILLTLLASGCQIILTITTASVIELITIPEFQKAIFAMLFVIGISLFQRGCWYVINVIYFKYSNKN